MFLVENLAMMMRGERVVVTPARLDSPKRHPWFRRARIMAARNHTTSERYVHPDDPAGYLKPGDRMVVDGLDWSWAFVWFKAAPGYPGYCVGHDGSVWSLWKRGYRSGIGNVWLRKALIQDDRGYMRVSLMRNAKSSSPLVHRLVLIAFCGPCPKDMEACHFPDRDRSNCRIDNLKWGTRKENHSHKKIHGTQIRGTDHHAAKLEVSDIAEIFRLSDLGWPQSKIARRFPVGKSRISAIIRGESWKHLGLHRSTS